MPAGSPKDRQASGSPPADQAVPGDATLLVPGLAAGGPTHAPVHVPMHRLAQSEQVGGP